MKKIVLVLLCLVANLANANQLLIISSGLGMYGSDDGVNIGVERFGASLVEEALKYKYSKVHKIITYEISNSTKVINNRIEKTLKSILERSKVGERLDVFTMQHGPDGTPFDGLSLDKVKTFLPHGFVRHVYATSCSEFGDIVFNSNKDNYVTDYNKEFSVGLEEMGVDTYMYHANTNSTGAFTLPILLKNLKRNKSWAKAGIQTYKEFDNQMAKLIPNILAIKHNKSIAKYLPTISDDLKGWEEIVISRLVIGQKKSLKNKDLSELLSLNLENDDYSQRIVPMQPALERVVAKHCTGGLSEYDTVCEKNAPKKSLTSIARSLLDSVQFVFDTYDTSEKACLKGVILNQLVQSMDYDINFQELCFEKSQYNIYKIKWKLAGNRPLNLGVKVDLNDIDEIRKIKISNKGQIKFKIKNNGKIKIRIRGITVYLNGLDGEGKGKLFTFFRPRGLNIFNNGRAEGKVSLFGIPLSAGVEAQEISDIDMIDFVKLFGFRINI
jgi:hypothetical protein